MSFDRDGIEADDCDPPISVFPNLSYIKIQRAFRFN